MMSAGIIRNIVVFVAGTDEEYQGSILEGISEAAKVLNFNITVFTCFGGLLDNAIYDAGEYSIYRLANLSMFDGAILLTNTISDTKSREYIFNAIRESNIPAVVFDSDADPSFYNIRIDNTAAMRQIVEHLIEKHHAKTFNFISGPLENPEAKQRYEAFLAVMNEHAFPVDTNRIYFGNFRPDSGRRAAASMLASNLPLPDALIAANDAMALEAINILQEHGIRVPEDVIVTGFDHTFFAQHHCPTLTSVARPLAAAGKAACELFKRLFDHESCEKEITLKAYPVYLESCGCCTETDMNMRSYRTESYATINRYRNGIYLLNRLTSALAVNESPEDCIHTISHYLHQIKCEQCCICLCENWESAFLEKPKKDSDNNETHIHQEILTHGYTEYMTAPLIWQQGVVSKLERFRSAELFPLPIQNAGNISYVLPLHFRERCLGYYIFTNTDFPTRTTVCHSLLMNISHSFESIRKLLNLNNTIRELDRIYVVDQLCGIYNRNGFIRLADKMFRHSMEQHDTLMISFIDMDGLKYINDNFGHEEGDFALRKLAEIIDSCCYEGQICARFGGDEFITITCGLTEEDAEKYEAKFCKQLQAVNALINKPYELSASIGSFVTTVEADMKLFALIAQADQIMYEQKKRKSTSRYLRR